MVIDAIESVGSIPAEGSPTFRVDAATAWMDLKSFSETLKNSTIPQMNALSLDVSNKQSQVSSDLTSAVSAKNEAVTAKNEAVTAKDEAIAAKEIIEGINDGISNAIVTAIESQIGEFTQQITTNTKRRKMSEFGITL